MAGILRLSNTGTGNGQSTITSAASGDTTYTLPSGGGTFVTTASTQALTVPFASGTAGAPSVTFIGDTDTGLYSPGANQVALSTSGTGRLFVSSAGLVGIGTNVPAEILDVHRTGFNPVLALTRDDAAVAGALYIGAGTTLNYIQSQGAKDLNFQTDSIERARIDSSGRLLVGTSSARSNFFNTTLTAAFQIEGTNHNTSSLSLIRNEVFSGTQFGPNLVLGSSGGTTNGSNTLSLNNGYLGSISFQGTDGTEFVEAAVIRGEVDGTPGANDMPGRLVFLTTADGGSGPSERMRIQNQGDITFGKGPTNWEVAGAQFESNSKVLVLTNTDTAFVIRRNSSNGNVAAFHRDGTQVGTISVTTTATAYNTSSDYRLKENVAPVTDGIARLQQLKPSRFNFIADPAKTVDGFLAHEAAEVVPECVTGEKDAVDADGNPQYQGIDQSKLVPLLTAALQEAVAKIESLEARLTTAGI